MFDRRGIVGAIAVVLVAVLAIPASAVPTTIRVSVNTKGRQGHGWSYSPAVSADGRFVAFESSAPNLVGGDGNGVQDVFVHNRVTGVTARASVRSGGAGGNAGSHNPSISGDGRLVAFESDATNLVAHDDGGKTDVFVHNMRTGKTRRISVRSNGAEANSDSYGPVISGNGRVVAFYSYATNLVARDHNGLPDVFVHNMRTRRTTRVSVNSSGKESGGPPTGFDGLAISEGGSVVAFASYASNLVAGDRNRVSDVFVHNRATGRTTRVSVRSNGVEALGCGASPLCSYDPAVSEHGRFVAFSSRTKNLVPGDTNGVQDVFVHDRKTGKTKRASLDSSGHQVRRHSANRPSISGNGRYVVFSSRAKNLVPGDTNGDSDVFLRNLTARRTVRVSVSASGAQARDGSDQPAISADGRYVAFQSEARNLVAGDTNGKTDVFLRGPLR